MVSLIKEYYTKEQLLNLVDYFTELLRVYIEENYDELKVNYYHEVQNHPSKETGLHERLTLAFFQIDNVKDIKLNERQLERKTE